MNTSLLESSKFYIPEIWLNIFSHLSYQDIFNFSKLLFLAQKNTQHNYNIDNILITYINHKIHTNKLNRHIYHCYLNLKSDNFVKSPQNIMVMYTKTYNITLNTNFKKSLEHTYFIELLSKKIPTNSFKLVTSYVRRIEIMYDCYKCNKYSRNTIYDKCNNCKQLVYWNKLIKYFSSTI